MIFVPYVPPPQPPSPRTRELASLLGRVIEEYEKHHPAVSAQEVKAALQIAASSSRKGGGASMQVAAAVGLAAVLAVGGFVWLATSGGTGSGGSVPMVALSVGVILVVMLVAVMSRRGPG